MEFSHLSSNNEAIQKLLSQIFGHQLSNSNMTFQQVQTFVSSVDNLVNSNKTLVNLGKSLHGSNTVLIVVDRNSRVLVWNNYVAKLTGYKFQQVRGKSICMEIPGILPVESCAVIEKATFNCLNGKVLSNSILTFNSNDLRSSQILCTFSPLLGNPYPEGMLILGLNIDSIVASAAPSNAIAETPVQTAMSLEDRKPAAVKQTQCRFPGWEEVSHRYTLESVLGQGSYGQVAKARNKTSGEIVAIKKILNVFADPIDAKRILRELCILRQLHHPNIVQVKEILCPSDLDNFVHLYVIFEYLPTDLEKLLHSPQFLSAEHLRWLILDLLKALKYLHSAEIVHRDLKPANILLNLSPVAIKICDFGLARGIVQKEANKYTNEVELGILDECQGIHPRTPRQKLERQLTEHVVTRWYRAPEIIFRDHAYSTEIDVWSIGCIFAELLSMQKASVSSHYYREPLFPGVSCFPLSPGAHSPALPQDSRDQLNVILDVLGTMDEEDIKEVADPDVRSYLRSLEKRPRKPLNEVYPGAEDSAIELLEWMLKMNPRKRATIDQALGHKYLDSIRSLEEEVMAPGPIKLPFDEKKLTIPEIRALMKDEIRYYHPDNELANGGSEVKKHRG